MLRAPGRDTEVFCPQAAQGQQTCRYCVVGVQLEVQTALQLRYLKYIKEKVIPLACDTGALYKSPFKFSPVLPSQKLHPTAVCKLHPQQTMPARRMLSRASERDAACPRYAAAVKGRREGKRNFVKFSTPVGRRLWSWFLF